jgi:hypothetical protein
VAKSYSVVAPKSPDQLTLELVATFPNLRALAWNDEQLYASRGYTVLRGRTVGDNFEWEQVAQFRPPSWRLLSSRHRLTFRLVRDGFHALARLSNGSLVGAVPHAIVVATPGEHEFRVSHRVIRGTRPLHFAVTPDNRIFWGEYFDNPQRDQVHIYGSTDLGETWEPAYTFQKREIRHVHNIVYDRWRNCLWISTGDNGQECRILRASCDFATVEQILAGSQQTRCVALLPREDGIYFASDTPVESNHLYHMNVAGEVTRVGDVNSSSIYGCCVGEALFFSTMIEPSAVNRDRTVRLYVSRGGREWSGILEWAKDEWSPHWFQYGNAFLPDGNNTTGLLAVSTIAVKKGDCQTGLWRVLS